MARATAGSIARRAVAAGDARGQGIRDPWHADVAAAVVSVRAAGARPAAHDPRRPRASGSRPAELQRHAGRRAGRARAIGTQIAAQTKGFLPFDAVGHDPQQLRLDYERLRITWELTRDIGLERELDRLLDKILLALFKFTKADRCVILLREDDGSLHPRAARRRDGTEAPIQVSSTILNHVIKERASVLTHDASMDFAASKGKSMILNRISSAMVVPLLHESEKEVLGVLWLDSESLAQFQPKDLEVITSVAGQAAMFIENTILAKKVEQEIVMRDRFVRLVAPNVAEQMMSGKLEVKKGGQLVQELSVFNSDIRGFTQMSEGTAAEVIVDMLNEYFEPMVETLFKYEGTLDKFMGDGIMAFWGSPLAHRDDAIRCVQCALDQMEILGRFNRQRMGEGKPPLGVGIGIHTGPGRRRVRRELESAVVHGHRGYREHERPAVRDGSRRPDRRQRADPLSARGPLRFRGDRAALTERQGEADAPVQRRAREAERGGEGRLEGRCGNRRALPVARDPKAPVRGRFTARA